MRIGAVNYLNSKPLVYGLQELAPDVRLSFDLPSRLADSLAAGRMDVALVPSVEFFRSPGCAIVSDACVACAGPVLSVKLYFRVPPGDVRRVALDEGSRTSAALTQILLAELCGVRPQFESLPIGFGMEASDADAVLLIGDRAIENEERDAQRAGRSPATSEEVRHIDGGEDAPARLLRDEFCEIWDLGKRWFEWAKLPFVFAMWVARPGVAAADVAPVLNLARDEGVRHAGEIAAKESTAVGISCELATQYLRHNLHFTLGRKERAGLRKFYELCVQHGLAPSGLEKLLDSYTDYGCAAK